MKKNNISQRECCKCKSMFNTTFKGKNQVCNQCRKNQQIPTIVKNSAIFKDDYSIQRIHFLNNQETLTNKPIKCNKCSSWIYDNNVCRECIFLKENTFAKKCKICHCLYFTGGECPECFIIQNNEDLQEDYPQDNEDDEDNSYEADFELFLSGVPSHNK